MYLIYPKFDMINCLGIGGIYAISDYVFSDLTGHLTNVSSLLGSSILTFYFTDYFLI